MNAPSRDWNVLSMLEWGTRFFKKRSIPDPRLSIEWLLAEVLSIDRLDLYLQFDRPLSPAELEELRPLVKRRARHEPLQYILGFTEFMNARLTVTPDVMIPRIETEQLIEIILEQQPEDSSLSVLDIGTGSGCIPIALKLERPGWEISSVEISEPALEIARENAESNEVEINLFRGDIHNWRDLELDHSFDLVISNPPYVLPSEKESLQEQVVEYEPSLALFSDEIEPIYRSIISLAKEKLTESGGLYLEIHELHGDEIIGLFDSSDWQVKILKDYENKDRFITARKT